MDKYINTANSVRRLQIKENNRIKIIKWLENRKNKTVEEEKTLICAKKDYTSMLGIIYFIVILIYIIAIICLSITLGENWDTLILLQIPILLFISIIMINITSIVTRDYNKLIERISKFTDLYLSDHRNKFSIMFDGANINDYDFAKNFVHYANQYPNEFEEMWSKIKPYNILEKIRHKLVIIIVLLLIFGLPLYFIVFKNSNLSLNDLIYDTQLHASEYIVVETKYNEQKELIVTVKYNVNGKEYTEDVKVKGNEWNWRINGGLYYNDNKPENLIYIEN